MSFIHDIVHALLELRGDNFADSVASRMVVDSYFLDSGVVISLGSKEFPVDNTALSDGYIMSAIGAGVVEAWTAAHPGEPLPDVL